MEPLISVLMPVYNSALFLPQAIESILEQSFKNFELIIVDDGSTDNSLEIAKSYGDIDERIQVFSQSNIGISRSRNRLLSLSKGKYIAWMDSDDLSLPERLAIQYDYLTLNNDVVALGVGTEFIDEDGMKICEWRMPTTHEEIDKAHINGQGGAITFASSMMLKSSLEKVGIFDESVTGAEDLCLLLRLAEQGRLANVSETLYQYRQHINSVSHASKQKIIGDNQHVVEAACIRRGVDFKRLPVSLKASGKQETLIKWGWWALGDDNVATARKYAKKAIFMTPYNIQAWKLLVCSIRGY